jgi:LemA protein
VNALPLAAAFAVGLVVAIVLFLIVVTYNDVVSLQRRIDKAWANIEVALQQRFDQLPNLVEAVRGVMTFERDVLSQVTAARAAFVPGAPVPEQAAASAATSRAIRTLLATVEAYPAVRSAGNVLALQGEIERLESILADRRELYNDQVYRYNTRIGQVPGVLLAGLFGWSPRPFFDAEPAAEGRPDVELERAPSASPGADR